MSVKPPKEGYTVLDSVDVAEGKDRALPNSDPAKGNNFTYQDQPWDESDPQTGRPGKVRR